MTESHDPDPASLTASIPTTLAGQRVDRALAALFPDFSREKIKQWFELERVKINGRGVRPAFKVAGGERVVARPLPSTPLSHEPEALRLELVRTDHDFFVIDKPAGLVVHPGAGNPTSTMLNGLLHLDPTLAHLPRAGIVHRLDKDTSGLLVVARTEASYRFLVNAIAQREVRREYLALVKGRPPLEGEIDAPIGRHPRVRTRMAVTARGKPARTTFRVLEEFEEHSLLLVRLDTGRTHQIRVHLQHAGFALAGDPVYGPRRDWEFPSLQRQALHAWRLSFAHPDSGTECETQSELPEDMRLALQFAGASGDQAGGDEHE